jgi:hypothetical protein
MEGQRNLDEVRAGVGEEATDIFGESWCCNLYMDW